MSSHHASVRQPVKNAVIVHRAYDPQLEREVALKVPQPGCLDSTRVIERFLREAKAAARLRHPNIVPVYDAGKHGEHYYIAAAFIDRRTLSRVIDEEEPDFRRAAEIVRDLAEALGYAHELGIVHRDVKPANVMMDARGQPHLMDFGLAHRLDCAEKLTQDGTLLGTPGYMAPEQAKGKSGDALPANDQYSLGVILYELLCGQTPFRGPPEIVIFNLIHQETPTPRTVQPRVPRDLETICLKAMAKQPENRYRGCQLLADDLRRWLEGEPIRARRQRLVEQVVRWCRWNRAVAALVAAVAFLLVVGTVVSSYFAIRSSRFASQADLKATEAVTSAADARREQERANEKAVPAAP